MAARHQIESHKFWDIVALWAKEQQESEEVVAAPRSSRRGRTCAQNDVAFCQRVVSDAYLRVRPQR